jgi:hypothetical protein
MSAKKRTKGRVLRFAVSGVLVVGASGTMACEDEVLGSEPVPEEISANEPLGENPDPEFERNEITENSAPEVEVEANQNEREPQAEPQAEPEPEPDDGPRVNTPRPTE